MWSLGSLFKLSQGYGQGQRGFIAIRSLEQGRTHFWDGLGCWKISRPCFCRTPGGLLLQSQRESEGYLLGALLICHDIIMKWYLISVDISCNISMGQVTSHYLCYINTELWMWHSVTSGLLIRSKAGVWPMLTERGPLKGMNTRRPETLRIHPS